MGQRLGVPSRGNFRNLGDSTLCESRKSNSKWVRVGETDNVMDNSSTMTLFLRSSIHLVNLGFSMRFLKKTTTKNIFLKAKAFALLQGLNRDYLTQ